MDSKEENNKYCDICDKIASMLCFDCVMYLCDSCFKFIHEQKINKIHKNEKIDYFVSFDLKCKEHPKDRINLFCLEENGKY